MRRWIIVVFLSFALAACSGLIPKVSPGFDPDTHIVEEGESLNSIAEQYGLKPRTILQSNSTSLKDDPKHLEPGVELLIPPIDGAVYRWSEGDRITSVAAFFGVEPSDIIEFNGNNLDESLVSPNGTLEIPGGTPIFVPGGERLPLREDLGGDEKDCSLWYPTNPPRCVFGSME